MYGAVDAEIHIFLTLVQVGGEWSVSRPDSFIRWGQGPQTGLDDMDKRKFFILSGLELRFLGCPTSRCVIPDHTIISVCDHVSYHNGTESNGYVEYRQISMDSVFSCS
jgi:hypothetical protein